MWLLLGAVVLLLYYLYKKNSIYNQKCSQDGVGVVVYRFHKPSCPYCVESKDAWDKFSKWAYQNGINAVEEDITNVKENANKFNVQSVPTVLMVKEGKVISRHEGPRTPGGYVSWAVKNC